VLLPVVLPLDLELRLVCAWVGLKLLVSLLQLHAELTGVRRAPVSCCSSAAVRL